MAIPIFKKLLSHPKWRPFCILEFFTKIAKHKNTYISKTVLDRAISTKFLTHRVSLESSHPNFQNNFVSTKMAAILNFRIFRKKCKTQKCIYISKVVLDRADYADFGCHNSIRLKAEHFLNTLALTFISFSRRFVFAV